MQVPTIYIELAVCIVLAIANSKLAGNYIHFASEPITLHYGTFPWEHFHNATPREQIDQLAMAAWPEIMDIASTWAKTSTVISSSSFDGLSQSLRLLTAQGYIVWTTWGSQRELEGGQEWSFGIFYQAPGAGICQINKI